MTQKNFIEEKIQKEKNELRKIFKAKRDALSQSEIELKSQKISENFINNLLPKFLAQKPDAVFALYISANNEVSVSTILKHFQENKISFCYPRIKEKNHPLEFILHQENQVFSPNIFYKNILEPVGNNIISPDFILIPLVAFDKKRHRIGMGSGFFDRTLAHFKTKNHKFTTIGLAYDLQLSSSDLPTIETDRSLDIIACESLIFCQNQHPLTLQNKKK